MAQQGQRKSNIVHAGSYSKAHRLLCSLSVPTLVWFDHTTNVRSETAILCAYDLEYLNLEKAAYS